MSKKQTRIQFVRAQIYKQRKWIEDCEARRSYSGTNGREIRKVDMDALFKWENELATLTGGEIVL